ncbi:NAD(P)/FAD-dependent oxidoreductase [Desulforamulus reducens]|uniref:NAD(P)/FAD-dependent oxidoreductase n=1 Tax=Desulforamulus reducens TaxID=59610 RepID=UPI00006AF69E|nr:NAD(P)/FAD-dependent oxidoreductase [Desulforamulus reducens]
MKYTEVAIVGGGPAGLTAAMSAAKLGAEVILIDRNDYLGGQLIKQTHRFFGSKQQRASERGIDIARELSDQVMNIPNIQVMTEATVLGYYEDGVLLVEQNKKIITIHPKRIVISTGGAEKTLLFPNNDLPGVYGAGAVQTLVNVYGVKPGKKVLMVGAGNIGVIVSYQLLQAGIEVVAIIEAAPKIGAYWVHAAKVVRAGVPILTRHTIVKAHGEREVNGATVVRLDENWQPITGTQKKLDVDVICLSVGLTPLSELLWQAGCKMVYVPELGGNVPLRNEHLETSVPGIYVAGDVAGIEEASAAMMEGSLAGLEAAASLGYTSETLQENLRDVLEQLKGLRSGSVGEKIRKGMEQVSLG